MAAARAGQIRTGHDQAGRAAPVEANPEEAQSFDEAKHARDRRCSNTVKRMINPRHNQGRSVHCSTVLNQIHTCNVSSKTYEHPCAPG
jgi:hypothetical protein